MLAKLLSLDISISTIGAGIILGARVTVPAFIYAVAWDAMTPWLRENHWLGEKEPFRKFAFLVALGTIMGAAVVDIFLILRQAAQRIRQANVAATDATAVPVEEWKQTNTTRLVMWLGFWGLMVIGVSVGANRGSASIYTQMPSLPASAGVTTEVPNVLNLMPSVVSAAGVILSRFGWPVIETMPVLLPFAS